jgi:general secretion pathway protein K
MARERETGFALVAAVAAVGAFAYISFEVMAADRGVTASVSARVEQARLAAAADGGMMMAIHGLGQEDIAQRWAIDGRGRELVFNGVDLLVTVQDERGKAPLDGLNPAQARALFEGAGAASDRVDALVTELRDFQSADEQDQPDVSAPPPPGLGAAPVRRGGFRTVGDLMSLKDMDSDLYSRIAPAVTVFFEESGPFEPTHATPLAVAAMAATEDQSPEELQAQQSADNEQPEQTIVDDNLLGRTLTVNVVARGPRGAQTHRAAIVELTGAKAFPYWVRYVE